VLFCMYRTRGPRSADGADSGWRQCAEVLRANNTRRPSQGSRAWLMFGLGTAAGGLALLVLYGVPGVLGVVLHILRG
jgi:hypothetical protein